MPQSILVSAMIRRNVLVAWVIISVLIANTFVLADFLSSSNRGIDSAREDGALLGGITSSGTMERGSRLISSGFIENRGQLPREDVRFYFASSGLTVGFRETGLLVVVRNEDSREIPRMDPASGGKTNGRPGPNAAEIVLNFDGAHSGGPTGLVRLEPRRNFLLGSDPIGWHTAVASYESLAYRNLYDGIDLSYTLTREGFKYDFYVRPGADARSIRMTYEGADEVLVDDSGGLEIHTAAGVLRDSAPEAFQEGNPVPCVFVPRARFSVGFRCDGIDPGSPFVIDPIVYGTFLGDAHVDRGWSIAIDEAGNPIVTGVTESPEFPATAGAFDTSLNGTDGFIAKFNPTVSALLFCTYLGGAGRDESFAIALDPSGFVYVTGVTFSADFPTTTGVLDRTRNGSHDAFVTKLSPSLDALVFSTLLGGSSGDHGNGLTLDNPRNVYVVGKTSSTDFPADLDAPDHLFGGCCEGFVAKLAPDATSLVFSTFLGGSSEDIVNGIALDASARSYVMGMTISPDFPTLGALDPTCGTDGTCNGGQMDMFVTRLNPSGKAFEYSTFLGGSGPEGSGWFLGPGRSIAVDSQQNAYVTGDTMSQDYPTTPGVVQENYGGGLADAVVTKVNPSGTGLVYSTYIGGNSIDYGFSLALTAQGEVWLTGQTTSSNFPVTVSGQCYQSYFLLLSSDGSTREHSECYGASTSSQADISRSISLDGQGCVWTTGDAGFNFPATPGAYDEITSGIPDAFVAKLRQSLDLRGVVWNDLDRDAMLDPGEYGIWGVTVELRDATFALLAQTTTGYDGTYRFADLVPGTYQVVEQNLYGWQSSPGSPDIVVVTPACQDVTANFGDYSPEGREQPSFAVSTGVAGGGQANTRVGLPVRLSYQITNTAAVASQLRFLTFTAAIKDSSVGTFASPPIATWTIYSHTGNVLASGTTTGTLTLERHGGFDPSPAAFFQMATWGFPELLFLEGGGLIIVSFEVVGVNPGQTKVELFPRSSEDNPEVANGLTLPVIQDKKNLWMDNSTGLWYPAHNSYDPWDDDLNSGHWWNQLTWLRATNPGQNGYAKDSWTVTVTS